MSVRAVCGHPVLSIVALKDPCSDAPERTLHDSVPALCNIFPNTTEQQYIHFRWQDGKGSEHPLTRCSENDSCSLDAVRV
ncbi:hypothetical protein TNCV_782551 [Trichonephila clavipes]|nr:hypothetical protein TNCV_782551 [Trichonephila clavipes]